MSGHVSDEESRPVRVDGNKPVEVSSDGRHRIVSSAHAQAADFRNAVRENRGLYIAGDLEFVFDREQAAFVGKDFFCRDPTLRGHKKNKCDRLKEWIFPESEKCS